MNVLAMGINLWQDDAELEVYTSRCAHEVRTLGVEGTGKRYTFAAGESAGAVVSRISREWPVDLLLCGCPEMYPPPLHAEDCPVKTAAIISDWNLYQPQLEHSLARFDVVLSDLRGTRDLCLAGAKPRYWGPIYSHRPRVHRDLGLLRDIDIGYFGNLIPAAHPRRARLLGNIAGLSQRHHVVISGEHPQAEYAALLNRSRIAFNCSIRGEMNLRCFEAPACGALLFIERDNEEASSVFTHAETAVCYTDDNLQALLDTYLDNEVERARIARAGQALVEGMRAVARLDGLLDWLAAEPSSGRPYHRFDQPTRLRADAMGCSSAVPGAQHPVAREALRRWLEALPNDPAALLANGCHAFDAAMWAGSDDRKSCIQEAGRLIEKSAHGAGGDATPWYNLGVLMEVAGQSAAAVRFHERALNAKVARLAAFALGKRTDPDYIDLRWRLALGQDCLPALYAMTQSARDRIG